jgi:nitrous oxidase accessory protein NosD
VDKHASQDGTVQTFQHYGARDRSRSGTFADAPYNEAITIRNNTFRDLDTAVSIRNAQDVTVEANTFEGVETPVTVDAGSTRSVTY